MLIPLRIAIDADEAARQARRALVGVVGDGEGGVGGLVVGLDEGTEGHLRVEDCVAEGEFVDCASEEGDAEGGGGVDYVPLFEGRVGGDAGVDEGAEEAVDWAG